MKSQNYAIIIPVFFLYLTALNASAQGLPPGWEFVQTPSTHIISVPLVCEPDINGWPLKPGDYVGGFYLNDEGVETCGGATMWLGDANTGIILFGDDNFSTEKDGFDSGEWINWKAFSWSVVKAYDAEVTCDTGSWSSCTNYTANGLAILATFDAEGFYMVLEPESDSICVGSSVQLNVIPSGGSGSYTYNWSSIPAGFTSTISNPVVNPAQSTQYIAEVTSDTEYLTDTLSIIVVMPPTVDAGGDQVICENQNVQLSGNSSNAAGVEWISSGDGIFSNPYIPDPVYFPGANDLLNGSASLTLIAIPFEPCLEPANSSLTINIILSPTADAGDDETICENAFAQLNAVAANYGNLVWITAGDGTFSNTGILDPEYTPGTSDITNGQVQLTFTAEAVTPCTINANDDVVVFVSSLPNTNAGNNITICEGEIAQLVGIASNYLQILWTSDGDGIFSDPTELSATYTPGINDISNGSVSIALTATPFSPCTDFISDDLVINIVNLPVINAGSDATICETNSYQVSASAINYDEVVWSGSGDGTFDDPNALVTLYTPGAEDILSGEVVLTLTALPEFPCNTNIEDGLVLTINSLPQVNAGENAVICENENHQLSGSATVYLTIQWLTSGDGNFSNPATLNPTYFPGEDDISTGFVTLTLSAVPVWPCSLIQEDSITLSIIPLPEVFAGDDQIIFSTETAQLNGEAVNFAEILWSSSGDGTFTNLAILDPVYTPGVFDISIAGATLTLTAEPIDPCTTGDSDQLLLTIDTTVNIFEAVNSGNLKIYPNPCRGDLYIQNMANLNELFSINIYDLNGRLQRLEFSPGSLILNQQTVKLNLRHLNPGIYIVHIDIGNSVFNQKIYYTNY
nr:T9SS type A sorting domain-containing protein [Bacteroidota bacterium]